MADDLIKFRRFLCYGSESSSCRQLIAEKSLIAETHETIKETAPALISLVESQRGEEVVKEIVNARTDPSLNSDTAVFSLAVCARLAKDLKSKQAAYKALPQVCLLPSHLFLFVAHAEKLSGETTGWGRAQRKAISDWYTSKDPLKLAKDVTQYKTRYGWSHKDILRLAHVKSDKESMSLILKLLNRGFAAVQEQYAGDGLQIEGKAVLEYVSDVNTVKHSTDEKVVAGLVEKHKLSREHLPTALTNNKEVWRAMLQHVPLCEVLPQLGKLTSIGLLDSSSSDNQIAILTQRLCNAQEVQQSGLQPIEVLLSQKTYDQGKNERGKLKWMPSTAISESLKTAYYSSFKNVRPSGVRYLMAVDINGDTPSSAVLRSTQLKPLLATAGLAMVMGRSENTYQLVGYSQTIAPARLTPQMPIQEVVQQLLEVTRKTAAPSTDCSLPLLWAADNKKEVDVFVILTDCESSQGAVSPLEALIKYRKDMNIPDARLIVFSLTSDAFSLADDSDPGMLDIIGYDAATANVLRRFACKDL